MNWKKRITVALLACVMVMGNVLGGIGTINVQASEMGNTDWMDYVDGETALSAISIPGTHDTCTQHVPLGFIFRCQNTDVKTQLENGYRYLDLRLVLDEKDGKPAFVLKHNFAPCYKGKTVFSGKVYLDDVLADAYSFLVNHPSETIIMCMKAENGDDDIAEVQKLLYEYIDEAPEFWYTSNQIPMLEEVRGKIVLATRFEDKIQVGEDRRGLNFAWVDQGDREIVDVPYAITMINDEQALWVQDRFNYAIPDKLDAIYDDMENCQADENTFSLNFTSTSGKGKVGHPKKYARAINDELLKYEWQQGTCYGVVIVDFATPELAQCIYGTNE